MEQGIPVTQARADFAELVNRVVYGNERIVVTRHGRPLVALVSAADLDRLNALGSRRAAPVPSDDVVAADRRSPGPLRHRGPPREPRPPEPPRQFAVDVAGRRTGRRSAELSNSCCFTAAT